MAQWQRIHLSMQEMKFQSLGWEGPLEQEMATNSSIFFFSKLKAYLFIYFLIGEKLLYNVVRISAIQQCKSAIIIHILPPSSPPIPPL